MQKKIQKWLSPPDMSINQNTACEAHHNGTAAWFLEGSIYNEWKMTGSLLWTHGNRMVFIVSPPTPLIIFGFIAGSGKSIFWWVTLRLTSDNVANIRQQFVDHKGHRISTCNWIGFNRLLLLRFQGYRKTGLSRTCLLSSRPALHSAVPS